MIDCQSIQELLSAYMDDELPLTQKEMIQAHLAICPACRQELARLEHLWQALANLPETAPPSDLVEGVLARLPRQAAPWWRSLALAASLLVGIMLGGALGVNLHEVVRQPGSEPQIVALEVFEDFPPASLGTLVATYRLNGENDT
ncbi:MAG: zf-HC2 domain-containing protein [Deltaproteobacteria bacterium]|nr:zf-HC2 domain-containing protein [Deltaproteobacteria bacterium]MBW1952012.1 zf-HC2 domain-containing protein [Deltaproteobacteria bacterium]MBW1986076.1 zf-HC2 domain-containing protein [Deltaproteobacteria bacterium]MBW2134238.1 zf-HC2 domain-containing protein [Deltaproteobacteria bacterium]